MSMIIIYFNDLYYETFTIDKYPQLELKPNRPYIPIVVDGQLWGIPFRSNIPHPHVYYTDRKKKCGLDYSKAVPVDDKYVKNDLERDIYIRQNEFDQITGNIWKIKNGFKRYLELYKAAKDDPEMMHRDKILSYSSLQYFEDII